MIKNILLIFIIFIFICPAYSTSKKIIPKQYEEPAECTPLFELIKNNDNWKIKINYKQTYNTVEGYDVNGEIYKDILSTRSETKLLTEGDVVIGSATFSKNIKINQDGCIILDNQTIAELFRNNSYEPLTVTKQITYPENTCKLIQNFSLSDHPLIIEKLSSFYNNYSYNIDDSEASYQKKYEILQGMLIKKDNIFPKPIIHKTLINNSKNIINKWKNIIKVAQEKLNKNYTTFAISGEIYDRGNNTIMIIGNAIPHNKDYNHIGAVFENSNIIISNPGKLRVPTIYYNEINFFIKKDYGKNRLGAQVPVRYYTPTMPPDFESQYKIIQNYKKKINNEETKLKSLKSE